jgi:hypothetical protein
MIQIMPEFSSDLIWTIISFLLTVAVFSYLLGDNAVFRFVSAIFIGATAGYFAVIIIFQIILPRLVAPIMAGSLITLVPLLLSGLLILKLSPKLTRFGNISMAYLVGIGAAVAIGGALMGTLFGQVKGALNAFTTSADSSISMLFIILEATFMLLGTIATLVYFNFGAKKSTGKRGAVSSFFAWIGQFFIAITLGAVFAGVLTTALTALLERSDYIVATIRSFIH